MVGGGSADRACVLERSPRHRNNRSDCWASRVSSGQLGSARGTREAAKRGAFGRIPRLSRRRVDLLLPAFSSVRGLRCWRGFGGDGRVGGLSRAHRPGGSDRRSHPRHGSAYGLVARSEMAAVAVRTPYGSLKRRSDQVPERRLSVADRGAGISAALAGSGSAVPGMAGGPADRSFIGYSSGRHTIHRSRCGRFEEE